MPTETLLVKLAMDADRYKREASQAATATGKIGTEADTATTAAGRMSSGLSTIGTVAKVAVAGAAGAAVSSFVKGAITQATDLNESINAVNVTFGDAAPAIHAIGETAAQSFGLAQSEFNSFAVQFSSFAESIATGSGRQVEDVIQELTGRIADFASVMNLDVPEAAEKFQSGLAGQTEPLRAFGIDVSANAVNQKALALGLADTTKELTEQDKVMARYALIMEQTEKTAGDFKNTQGDLANATRTMSAEFKDFQADVGGALIPFLQTAVRELRHILGFIDDLDRLAGVTGQARDSAGLLGGALVELSKDFDQIEKSSGRGRKSQEDFRKEAEKLVESAGTTDSELRKVRDGLDFLVTEFGLTSEQAAVLEEVIGKRLAPTTADMADNAASLEGELEALRRTTRGSVQPTNDLTTSVEALKAAEERQERATKFARQAIIDKRDALREVHNPLFAIVRLNDDLADAEDAVTEAAKAPGGITSQEYRDAVIDRADVIADLESTLIDLKNQGIDPTGAAARLMLADLGIPDEVIDEIFSQFDALQQDFEGRRFKMSISLPDIHAKPDGTWYKSGNKVFAQHGGIFEPRPGGHFVNVAEAGSVEGIIPFNKEGVGILAAALQQAMKAGGGGAGGNTFVLQGTPESLVNEVSRRVALEMRLVS